MKDIVATILGMFVVIIGVGGTAIYAYNAPSLDQSVVICFIWFCTFITGRASKE